MHSINDEPKKQGKPCKDDVMRSEICEKDYLSELINERTKDILK